LRGEISPEEPEAGETVTFKIWLKNTGTLTHKFCFYRKLIRPDKELEWHGDPILTPGEEGYFSIITGTDPAWSGEEIRAEAEVYKEHDKITLLDSLTLSVILL